MHFLNAEQVLRAPLPNLRVGQRGIQTTTTAGNIKVSYTGNIAHWDTFEQEVWDFMTRLRAYQHLARCSHLPVCPSDTILLVNRKAMVKELIQAGAEITLSARFLERAIAPVVSSVETLTDSPHGQSARSMLPDDVRFGDSWIVDTSIRPKNTQPDIVGKLHGTHDARVIGELKFVVTVDLKRMVSAALGTAGDHRKLCNILGELTPMRCCTLLNFHRPSVSVHGIIWYKVRFLKQLRVNDLSAYRLAWTEPRRGSLFLQRYPAQTQIW